MTWEEYRLEAFKTWNWKITGNDAIIYISHKLIEEFAEILGEHTKHEFHNKTPNYLGEIGDAMWYLAALSNPEFTNVIYRLTANNVKDKYDITTNCMSSMSDLLDWINSKYTGPINRCILQRLWDSLVEMINTIGLTLNEVFEANITKIRKRHGIIYNPNHYKGV